MASDAGSRAPTAGNASSAGLSAALRTAGELRAALGHYTEAVAGQTAYWIRASLRASRGESVVTLDPPDLGRLRISLRQESGRLTARIQAELPEVEALLREGGERIRERLESQGLRVDALVIEAAPARAARAASGPEQQAQNQERHGAQTTPQGEERHSHPPAREPSRGETAPAPGMRGAVRASRATPASDSPVRVARRTWAGLDVRA